MEGNKWETVAPRDEVIGLNDLRLSQKLYSQLLCIISSNAWNILLAH